jgi:hypothetical protein
VAIHVAAPVQRAQLLHVRAVQGLQHRRPCHSVRERTCKLVQAIERLQHCIVLLFSPTFEGTKGTSAGIGAFQNNNMHYHADTNPSITN